MRNTFLNLGANLSLAIDQLALVVIFWTNLIYEWMVHSAKYNDEVIHFGQIATKNVGWHSCQTAANDNKNNLEIKFENSKIINLINSLPLSGTIIFRGTTPAPPP